MLRAIDRFYGSTFYQPPPNADKEYGPCFRWRDRKQGPLVVFHPELQFDPWSADIREAEIIARSRDRAQLFDPESRPFEPFAPLEGSERMVLHESFRVKGSIMMAVQAFVGVYPNLMRLAGDEELWYNTGFWSARRGEENCVGISEAAAERYLEDCPHCDFAYVLCNPSTIIELFRKGGSNDVWIDVYLNNRHLPWAEMRRAVERTLDHIGQWASTKKEIGAMPEVLDGFVRKRKMEVRAGNTTHSELKLVAVAKIMSDVYHSAIAEWNFGTTPWVELDSMRYVLASIGPYLRDEELEAGSRFTIGHFYPYSLANCVLIDCGIQTYRERDYDPVSRLPGNSIGGIQMIENPLDEED